MTFRYIKNERTVSTVMNVRQKKERKKNAAQKDYNSLINSS